MLSVTADTRQVQAMLNGLNDALKGRAIAESINKVAAKANTAMKRAISREFNIKQSDVLHQLRVNKANSKGQLIVAELLALPKVRGRRARNVILFLERKVTLAEAKRRRKSGTLKALRFEIRRGRKVMIPGSFIVTANRGTFVATREGKQRMPIKAVQTIDVPQMFNTKRVIQPVLRQIRTEWLPQEINRAIQYALRRPAK